MTTAPIISLLQAEEQHMLMLFLEGSIRSLDFHLRRRRSLRGQTSSTTARREDPSDSADYTEVGRVAQLVTTKGGLYVFFPSITGSLSVGSS